METLKPNLNLFKAGDIVRAKRYIRFMYGNPPYHSKGSTHKITEETKAYFNVCQKDYELVTVSKE